MDINVTLIFQMIAFGLFVWFTMKLVWPPIAQAMEDRKAKIADGLAAAEKGEQSLTEAAAKSDEALAEARNQAQDILSGANKQASQIVEQAKEQAKTEADRIVSNAQEEVQREASKAREELRKQVGDLAVLGASKILKREVNAETHAEVLKDLAARV